MLTRKEPKNLYSMALVILAALLSIFITYTYARSITLLYGGIEIGIALFCYYLIFKNLKTPDSTLIIIFGILTTFSFFNGVLYGNLKSVLLLSISLVLPLAISVLPIDFTKNGKEFGWAFFIGLVIILAQTATGFLGKINSNTFGFYCYMSVSIGFVWYKMAKYKIPPLCLILFGCFLSAGAGSRNVAIILLISILLLILPSRCYKRKAFFRVVYLLAILYTIFAADIMEWIFENKELSNWLVSYTEGFSDKKWGMDERIVFLRQVRARIDKLPLYNKLFGEGILKHHGHNMFYQSIYIYGYIGTILLYAMYIRIFEMANTLISECDDKIALGCTVALVGVFFLNGGDLFLIGTEACAIIPQVLMGIIMLRYRIYKKEKQGKLSQSKEDSGETRKAS